MIPEINIGALSYFAASIFWRGSIHPWNDDGSIAVHLGTSAEEFRQYLMGERTFPRECYLWIVVREGKEISHLTCEPFSEQRGIFDLHKFTMPGLAVSLLVGKSVPVNYRDICFVNGVGNPVIVTPLLENLLEEYAVRLLARPS
jgi:hypothetical protein